MTRKVTVYWNSKVKAFSVRRDGRVLGHAEKILLREAKFVISEAGRRRFLKAGDQDAHAFIRGELDAVVWTEEIYGRWNNWTRGDNAYARVARKRLGVDVRYDPRHTETFVDIDLTGTATGIRTETPMAYLRVWDKIKPIILAFDPCLMTSAESEAATV
jgi:hypothetical protein